MNFNSKQKKNFNKRLSSSKMNLSKPKNNANSKFKSKASRWKRFRRMQMKLK